MDGETFQKQITHIKFVNNLMPKTISEEWGFESNNINELQVCWHDMNNHYTRVHSF